MKACRDSDVTARADSAGSPRAVSRALPIESRTAALAPGASPLSEATGPSTAPWYREAKMLPSTATPSAPPVWRVVSLTAEPTPALPGGSDPMIDSVAGAVVKPMPAPNQIRTSPPNSVDDINVSEAYIASAEATINSPPVTTRLVPTRSTTRGANGAQPMIPTATGAVSIPALSGEYPSTNWKYCVSRNVEPNRAKNVSVIAPEAAEKRGLEKIRTSSIG